MRKKISERELFHSPWMSVDERIYERDGQTLNYTVIHRKDGVIIIPVSESNNVLLTNNFRYPAEQNFWEFPMGGVEPDEDPKLTAQRELQEETGLMAEALAYLGSFHPLNGASTQIAHVYVANVTDAQLQNDIKLQEDEDIEGYKVVSPEELAAMVQSGEINDGFTLTAYLFYLTRHQK